MLPGRSWSRRTWYSVGGGFVVSGELAADGSAPHGAIPDIDVLPFPYRSADELLAIAAAEGTTIAGIVRRNEQHWRTDEAIDARPPPDLGCHAGVHRAGTA